MLKARMNEARLRLDITTRGPLLIKTGYATVFGSDMAPVETYRHGRKEIYLPGSTLKGILRSHLEKVANSIQPRVACNPLSRPNERETRDQGQLFRLACGTQFDNRTPKHEVYRRSCPTCRLFGSTSFSSRITLEDAYLTSDFAQRESLTEHRDGVAIDRLTGGGGSGGAKFDLDVVTEGVTFTTIIQVHNFEIWQLGMLFAVIQDMQDELIHIGSGRSRGLGRITAKINEQDEHLGGVVLSTPRMGKNEEPDHELWGLGRWLGQEAVMYGTRADDRLTLKQPVAYPSVTGIRRTRTFNKEALQQLQAQCVDHFVTCMQKWEPATETTTRRS
jgi:CRISPR-associated RAMP protein (TIGR02581 family)